MNNEELKTQLIALQEAAQEIWDIAAAHQMVVPPVTQMVNVLVKHCALLTAWQLEKDKND